MTTSPRVEPPEELRGRDGWHWLRKIESEQMPCFWQADHKLWHFGIGFAPVHSMEDWRYVAPCLTPAEVAALRAERDAVVARAEALAVAAHTVTAALCTETAEVDDADLRNLLVALAAYRAASPEAKPAECPCTKGETCRWPNCPQTGDGIGHYP